MSAKKPKRKEHEEYRASEADQDEMRMRRSGALESGYHAPTEEDIDDIVKSHRTSSAPGLINADEGVRRDSGQPPGPIDSLSGKLEESAGEEIGETRSA